jgi:TRAP-type mannitol/chloroaromatic compound transport system substrate-binding protein
MDRRDFLLTTSGAVVAATSSASALAAGAPGPEASSSAHSSSAEGATVLRLGMAFANATHGPSDTARRLARRFETMTGGRYRIEIVADQTLDGKADLFFGSAHHFTAWHPAFAYFAGLPGRSGLAAGALAQWIAVGGGQMLWDDLAEAHGWKPLLAGHTGGAPLLWSRTPITGLDSLVGARVAADGLGADVVRALGGDPVAIPAGGSTAVLTDGFVEAIEYGGAVASLASGVARAAPHAIGSPADGGGAGAGLNGHGTALALNVTLPVWSKLSEADQAILAAAASESYQADVAEALVHERIARQVLEGSFGVRIAPWPSDVAEAIDRVAEATIAHVAGSDADAERIDRSYFGFRNMLSGAPAAPRKPAAIG